MDVLGAGSDVSSIVESLVRQRDEADGEAQLLVWNADDSVLEPTRIVADLRPLYVVVYDCRIVSPVSYRHLEVLRTDQLRRNYVCRSITIYFQL